MVKFVSYTGEYPNLCSGVLTLNINDKLYVFGNCKDAQYESFWYSGGRCSFVTVGNDRYGDVNIEKGPWNINVDYLPDELLQYVQEIEDVINENIPYGCCGGCL